MSYNPSDPAQTALIERVEYRADQVVVDGQTPPINRASIYQELTEARRSVLRKVPREFVYPAAKDGAAALNSTATVKDHKVILPMPADFIRFLRLEIEGWQTSADDLLMVGTAAYRLQANQYARADAAHPIAVLVPNFDSPIGQAIEAYPASSETDPVAHFAYVSANDAPEDMPEALIDAMVWEATGRVLQNMRAFDAATAAFSAAQAAVSEIRIGIKGEDTPNVPAR